MMTNQQEHLLKLVLKNGQVIGLFCEEVTLIELISQPKFFKMNDHVNDIFVSVEDICAFEIASNRKELPKPTESNGESQGTDKGTQQA
jgi:hypothetical protein